MELKEQRGTRLDRELGELLEELRVALPGVEVLFAFQLGVPFTERFTKITSLQEDVYLAAFLATAVATALLIAPVAFHRLRWRRFDKAKLLEFGNRMLLSGLIFLALSFCGMVFVVTDMILGRSFSAYIASGLGLLFVFLWFGLPLGRKLRDESRPAARP